MILILNFGGQYCHLIARRIRDLGVYAEIVPFDITPERILQLQPDGIILSGGPASVYERNAPTINEQLFSLSLPLLGICYGMQVIGSHIGARVSSGNVKEFGNTSVQIVPRSKLLQGLNSAEQVWMSHSDIVTRVPKGFRCTASSKNCPIAAFENNTALLYAIQFHAEVTNTPQGIRILKNFIFNICHAKKTWRIENRIDSLMQEIKRTVGNDSVIMGVSGGVDSTVAATLIHKAIGNRLYCVFVDHGLLRLGEVKEVQSVYTRRLKFKQFSIVNASKHFMDKLRGVTDPEEKRRRIGHTFIEVFEREVRRLERKHPRISILGQGTIYPDRIESAQPSIHAAKIKSHHNLTLPETMKLRLVEPIKDFYKDEVRAIGRTLKIPSTLLERHPFPGPGLAIRILGEVTPARIKLLQHVDAIFIKELRQHGLYDKVWQAFAALLPVKAVGVMGDQRTYDYIISLRAVTSIDAMTADWARLPAEFLGLVSNRIINEVKGVNRVLYDISQKPPSTIEYE